MHAFVVLCLVLIQRQEIGLGNVSKMTYFCRVGRKILAQSIISCHNSQSELLLLDVLFQLKATKQTFTVIVWVNLC